MPLCDRVVPLGLIVTLWSVPSRNVEACGGFFCTTFPMNQVSEQILFVKGEETVTAHVQIRHTGEAHDFAWVLPVPSFPELGISQNAVFQQLGFATRPHSSWIGPKINPVSPSSGSTLRMPMSRQLKAQERSKSYPKSALGRTTLSSSGPTIPMPS